MQRSARAQGPTVHKFPRDDVRELLCAGYLWIPVRKLPPLWGSVVELRAWKGLLRTGHGTAHVALVLEMQILLVPPDLRPVVLLHHSTRDKDATGLTFTQLTPHVPSVTAACQLLLPGVEALDLLILLHTAHSKPSLKQG